MPHSVYRKLKTLPAIKILQRGATFLTHTVEYIKNSILILFIYLNFLLLQLIATVFALSYTAWLRNTFCSKMICHN